MGLAGTINKVNMTLVYRPATLTDPNEKFFFPASSSNILYDFPAEKVMDQSVCVCFDFHNFSCEANVYFWLRKMVMILLQFSPQYSQK